MTIYHLLSNFRWTERSEPAADLVQGQQAHGAEAVLVCGRNRARPEDSVEQQARIKGLEPLVLELPKHFRLASAFRDTRALRRMMRDPGGIEVLHSHLPSAQITAVLAAGKRTSAPLIVHSVYEPDGPAFPLRTRILSAAGTSGWIVITERAQRVMTTRYGVPPERIALIEPAIDTERFASFESGRAAARAAFGLGADDFIVGIVARLGPTRRLELLLEAVRLIAHDCPRLRCLIVGRGEVDAVINRPAAAMGITDRITLGGYCRWDRLVAAYHAMDAYVYTTPGTDKSCRAVRESLTAGVPVLARRTGYLPELVDEGQTGHLFDDDPAALAQALKSVYRDREGLAAMSRTARQRAGKRFDRKRQAAETLAFYRHLQRKGYA